MYRKKNILILFVLIYVHAMGQIPPPPDQTQQLKAKQPRLHVSQRLHDLGTILEGNIIELTWLLENHGDADLLIERVKATCGCTVIKMEDDEKIVPPGRSVNIRAEFNSQGRRGNQIKSVIVYSNDPAEPELRLRFQAQVYFLYNIRPAGLVNFGALQRGQTATKTIDIMPTDRNQFVDIKEIIPLEESLFHFESKLLKQNTITGQRIYLTVADDAPMGRLRSGVSIRFTVDSTALQRDIEFRVEVVGDLAWQPRVIDTTRQASLPGKKFPPVIIHATNKNPFDILKVDVGEMFEVEYDMLAGSPPRTRYRVKLVLRDHVPFGPFGKNMRIFTSAVDQPVIDVPVFGIVAPSIKVEPPMVILVQDGTPKGVQRLIKLQISSRKQLDIADLQCSNDAVTVKINWDETGRYRHIRYLDVWLSGKLPKGTHQAVITMSTSVEGVEKLELPVTIMVP